MSHLFEGFPKVYAGSLTQFLRGHHYFFGRNCWPIFVRQNKIFLSRRQLKGTVFSRHMAFSKTIVGFSSRSKIPHASTTPLGALSPANRFRCAAAIH